MTLQSKHPSDLRTIVASRLCVGCGACAYVSKPEILELKDFPGEGIRPVISSDPLARDQREALSVCPAVQTDFSMAMDGAIGDEAFKQDWGCVIELWEGHAIDASIRFRGSSGGALTALTAYCIEKGGMHGVLHTGQSADDPLRNQTRLSRSREELLAAAGSRYSPASVCDGLALVENAPAPCAIIGKPSEIAAVRNARRLRPALDAKIGVTLSFFCAESPATAGTVALLEKIGVKPSELVDLRYRGDGWPGHFAPTRRGETAPAGKMTYSESWAFLQRFRPWSVQIWPDGSGEVADISCGDPWYEKPDGQNPGFSLVVVRTERGRDIVRGAMAAGYLKLSPAEPWKLDRSQSGLAAKKKAVWGRLLAMRFLGMATPRFVGTDLYEGWRTLSVKDKLRSTIGTVRRLLVRKLHRPLQLDPCTATRVPAPKLASMASTNADTTG